MIFVFIGFLILYEGIKNFKKGFMMYLVYKLLLVQNITLISIPGIPLLTLEMFMTIMFIILFFMNGKKYQMAHMKFPLRIPFLLLFLCWLLSATFGVTGFSGELSSLLKRVLEEILLIWMMWEVVETKEDFDTLFKYLSILIFFSCIYAFIEVALQDNPLINYEMTLNNDATRTIDYSYTSYSRGYRVRSIFEHAIGAGINWSVYFIWSIRRWLDGKRFKGEAFYLLTAALCIPCIVLTRMRSPLLFLVIGSCALLDFKKKRFYAIVLGCIVGVVALLPMLTENLDIFRSFFNAEAASSVGGSNIAMRITQHLAAIQLIQSSPFFGLGADFRNILSGFLVDSLLGMEGIWIQTIAFYGLFGTLSYIIYSIYGIAVIPYKFHSYKLLFWSLAYWIVNSASSLPGMHLYFYYIVFFYYIKETQLYQSSREANGRYGVYFKRGKIFIGKIGVGK